MYFNLISQKHKQFKDKKSKYKKKEKKWVRHIPFASTPMCHAPKIN